MNKYFDKIQQQIKKYSKITLFFHEYPDFDTLGSCFGLKKFIENKYPSKKVRIVGLSIIDKKYLRGFFIKAPKVSNDFIKQSLGIVLDTSNSDRVFTQYHRLAKETIRIDHHPKIENFCDFEWIDSKYSSACEMVGTLMVEWDKAKINVATAQYIYAGILTDTNRFMYPSTSISTLKLVEELYKIIPDRNVVHNAIYSKTIEDQKFEAYVTTLIKYDLKTKTASLLIPGGIFRKYNVQPQSMVWTMASIKGITKWTSIYYDADAKTWKGSIRSKSQDVSKIAAKYDGGGHKLASGFKMSNVNNFKKVISDLKNL